MAAAKEECTLFLKRDSSFPLKSAGKIALYGNGARNTRIGGTGSGEMNVDHVVTVEEGLTNAGFTITTSGWLDRYDEISKVAQKRFRRQFKWEAAKKFQIAAMICMGRYMLEPEYEIDTEPDDPDVDTAVYVLSRICGEGADRTFAKGDIALTDTEVRDILWCREHFAHFCLVLNTGGVVDLSRVWETENILLLSQLGCDTGTVLADILFGKVNPSGKLSASWAALEDYPFTESFGQKNDTRYPEGIFVGYRYLERMGKKVCAPFGFGLSYTEFEMEMNDWDVTSEGVRLQANVRNIGNFAGKEVAQLYVSVPEGRLCQPVKVLAAFAKTNLLNPGQEQEVCLEFQWKNIASYDEKKGCYLLEKGIYRLFLGNSSVNTECVGEISLDEDIVTRKAAKVLKAPDFEDFVPKARYDSSETESGQGTETVKRCSLRWEPDISENREGSHNDVNEKLTLLARANERAKQLSDDEKIALTVGAFAKGNPIAGVVGNEAIHVAGAAGETRAEVCPPVVMADGPAGLRLAREYFRDKRGVPHAIGINVPGAICDFLPKIAVWFLKAFASRPKKEEDVLHQDATALPIGTAIAQSFNPELAKDLGELVGREMKQFGVHLWLAPALNIQRDIRCGRNFEYFSEDPLVSGVMAAALTKGVQSIGGCGVTLKHFLCNNQERNRTQNNSMVSERAMREIYLRGFEIAIEDGNPVALMTSYNLLNGEHTSESEGIGRILLREQMGYNGLVMTDWIIGGYRTEWGCRYPVARADRVIAAGGDIFMPGSYKDYKYVKKAFEKGIISGEMLEDRAAHVLMTSMLLTAEEVQEKES